MQTETLSITGMTSASCAEAVQSALSTLEGVSDATVSLLRNQVEVTFDRSRTGIKQFQESLAKAGYGSRSADAALASQGSCCGGGCS